MQRAKHPALVLCSAALTAGTAWAQSAPVECKVVDPNDPRLEAVRVQLKAIEPMLADVQVRLEGLKDLRPIIEQNIAVALAGLDGELAQLADLDVQVLELDQLDDLGPQIEAQVAAALQGMEGKLARLNDLSPQIEAQIATALAGLEGQLAAACVACPPDGEAGQVRTIVVQPEGAKVKARRAIKVEPKVRVRTPGGGGGEPKVRVRTLREVEPQTEIVEVQPAPRARVIRQRPAGVVEIAPEPQLVEVAPAPRARMIRQRPAGTVQPAPKVRTAPRTHAAPQPAPHAMALGGVAGAHSGHETVVSPHTPHAQALGGVVTPYEVHVAPHTMALGGVAGVHGQHQKVQVLTPDGQALSGGFVSPQSPKFRTLQVHPHGGVGGVKVRKHDCSTGRCPHGCGPC